MQWLELKIPPPAAALLCAGLMWVVARQFIAAEFLLPARRGVSLILLLAAVLIDISAMRAFRAVRTTINPLNPHKTNFIVTSGIFRYSRNPMYLGLLLILLAWAVYLGNLAAFLFPVVFVMYITRFQIQVEERIIAGKFGEDYERYRRETRRWL